MFLEMSIIFSVHGDVKARLHFIFPSWFFLSSMSCIEPSIFDTLFLVDLSKGNKTLSCDPYRVNSDHGFVGPS